MNLRVGCVEYINALPFKLPFQLGEIKSTIDLIYDIPSKLNALLRTKQLDVALTSCVEYFDGPYEMLPGFGIAGAKQILSVNLYTQFPVESLSGKRVGLTHHSATSIALLKVLCRHLWKIEPKFEPLNRNEPYSAYDALLLIGDEALENLQISGFQTIDLAEAWYQLTSLPFVFAVFAVSKEMDVSKMTYLQHQFEQAICWSASHQNQIHAEALKRCPVSPDLIQTYYSLLQFRLGEREMEGLMTFRQLRSKDV